MPAPSIIAHRGFAGIYPENTLEAVESATAYPETAMIEIDVQPAACGTPIVFHDRRLDGRRDGRPLTLGPTDDGQLVRETSLETLSRTRVLSTDQHVPTLSSVLEGVPEGVGLNVELKNPGSTAIRPGELLAEDALEEARDRWRPFVERVLEDCHEFGGDLLFSSFCEGALAALRATTDRYASAPVVGADLEAGLEIARRYECAAIHPPRNAIAGTDLATESYGKFPGSPDVDLLAVAHAEGRAVNVWVIETWVQAAQLARAGVDGLIVEYPGLARRFGGDQRAKR